MVLENNKLHQVYEQVNALGPWVCGPKPTGVSCPHAWATVRLCDELSWANMVSELKVVPGMMWLTCEGECWKYFICETRSHIDKIVGCGLAYIFGELIHLLLYGFENNEPHKVYVQVNAFDPWVVDCMIFFSSMPDFQDYMLNFGLNFRLIEPTLFVTTL